MNDKQKETINKALLTLLCILTTIAFQVKLDIIDKEHITLLKTILDFTNSFNQYNIIFILLIPIFYHFYQYTSNNTGGGLKRCALIPAILFSFFMVMGYSYDKNNSWDMVINVNKLQWIKLIICFSGFLVFFYFCINYIFFIVDSCSIHNDNLKGQKFILKYLMVLKKKPFITAFVSLLIIYLPYIIISYPAIFGWDMDVQIKQAYSEMHCYSPGYTKELALKEGVYLNNHHPIAHTLLIHMCLEIGMKLFSSYNIGIFICALLQLLAILLIIAVLVQLLVELGVSIKYICIMLLYYIISPRIQSYMFFITKDVIFAVFSMLFLLCLFHMIINHSKRKYKILFGVSIFGIMLFRNDGRYLLIISFLLIGLLCKNLRKNMLIYTITVLLCSVFFSNIILPAFGVIPGSVREVLSIPFQQTARYLRDVSEPVTPEEKEAISKVLDYNSIVEKYNPEKSDSVKGTFNEKASKEELMDYFNVYLQMFFKHPSHYIQATINNYYYYFYPGPHLADYYWGYEYSEDVLMPDLNKNFQLIGVESAFSYPKSLKKYRETYEQLRENLSELPLISLLKSAATYSWILILLVIYCIRNKNKEALALTIPLCIQLLICLAGPCNGWYFRYIYPIAVCLPAIILLCLHLIKLKNNSTDTNAIM